MKHLLIPHTNRLQRAIDVLESEQRLGRQRTDDLNADIAFEVRKADRDRRVGGSQTANLLEIDPPRQYSNYERTVADLRESMNSRIADAISSQGGTDGVIVSDIAHEEADSAVPTYTYHRIIMIAERPEILDAGDVEGSNDQPTKQGGPNWTFDQLFGSCIYFHLREIAETAGYEYLKAACDHCGDLHDEDDCIFAACEVCGSLDCQIHNPETETE